MCAKYVAIHTCYVLNQSETRDILKEWVVVNTDVGQGDKVGGGGRSVLTEMRQGDQLRVVDYGQLVAIASQVFQPFQSGEVSETVQIQVPDSLVWNGEDFTNYNGPTIINTGIILKLKKLINVCSHVNKLKMRVDIKQWGTTLMECRNFSTSVECFMKLLQTV